MAKTKSITSMVSGFTHHATKGHREERLPSRFSRTQLTGGDPIQRSLGNYAKQTPGLEADTPSILTMGTPGAMKVSRGK